MKRNDIVYYLLYGTLAVDSVNGYLIRAHSVSLSPIYKAIILVACIAQLRSKKKYASILIATSMFMFIHSFYSYSLNELLRSADWMLKALYIYFIFEFLSRDAARGKFQNIITLAKISFYIIALNIWLGSFGFGYAQYSLGEQTFGTRGFIYAGNELSVALMCSGGLVMSNYIFCGSIKKYLIFSLFAIGTAALTAMKVSIISIGILFIFLPFLQVSNKEKTKAVSKFLPLIAIVVFPVVVFFSVNYFLFEVDQISRLTYFYEKNGLVSLLFSLRNVWALHAMDLYQSYDFISSVFGVGFSWTKSMPHGGIVEIDLIDSLMTYGLAGAIVIYGFFLWVIFNSMRNQEKNIRNHSVFLVALLLLVSITAGHVVFSGIAAPLIASVLAYGFHKVRPYTALGRL